MTGEAAKLPTHLPPTLPEWADRLSRRAASMPWTEGSRTQVPADGSARASAVLVLVGDRAPGTGDADTNGDVGADASAGANARAGADADVVLLERAGTLRRHAAQVAFPGGAADPQDANPAATALREAQEEIGLDPVSVRVLATLPELYIPPSGYVVTPVLAYWSARHGVGVLDAAEVAAVHGVAVADLADPAARFSVRSDSGYSGPAFEVDDLFIWGFTAWVLDHLLIVGEWSRDWDSQRFRDIPAHLQAGSRRYGSTVGPTL